MKTGSHLDYGQRRRSGLGPDIMSKSKRTQYRYRKASRGQQRLDAFAFLHKSKPVHASKTLIEGESESVENIAIVRC
ncbi:hypothetical protein BYT27DRAFT_7190574 [Phlegmacium glaucopus]|nr:hypothetical protein BYT27DRAFT_7190574 [Phlegmacium glaucopus]